MICQHLRELEEAIRAAGISETFRGQAWTSTDGDCAPPKGGSRSRTTICRYEQEGKRLMTSYQMEDVRNMVCEFASKIDAPHETLPTFGSSVDFGHPHIEINSAGYHFVVIERGKELERRTTHDLDELLYWIFESVTSGLAVSYELQHRISSQDCRRLIFARQLELLRLLNPTWADRRQEKNRSILQQHPFNDHLGKTDHGQ